MYGTAYGTCIYVYMYICTYMYICICIYIYIYIYIAYWLPIAYCTLVNTSTSIIIAIALAYTDRPYRPAGRPAIKCYPLWICQINREVENERKPKNQRFDLCFTIVFSQFYQKSNMILWSIRTFWYKGSAENKKNKHVRKKSISLKNSSLKQKVWFFQKSSDMV